MQSESKQLIVVLGMHRSGTSAITRGLKVLGVELGDKLIAAVEGDNSKGYWEDSDLNTLNIEMLYSIGSDWHNLTPIDHFDVETLREKGYFLKAAKLLHDKLKNNDLFGFKDPRVAKLLPFWTSVFSYSKIDVSYVLAIRHPISVIRSLEMRGEPNKEKSYLLWLGHVINSLSHTESARRVIVDYDHVMLAPDRELGRIADKFNLNIEQKELKNYRSKFLDSDLQHSKYEPNEIKLDPLCPALAAEIYLKLQEIILSNDDLCGEDFQSLVTKWENEFRRLTPALSLIDKLVTQRNQDEHTISVRDAQIAETNNHIVDRDKSINQLHNELAARDNNINKLQNEVAERDTNVHKLNLVVAEQIETENQRNEEIEILNLDVSKKDAQVTELTNSVDGYVQEIESLKLDVSKKDTHVIELTDIVDGYVQEIESLKLDVSKKDTHVTELTNIVDGHVQEIETLNQKVAKKDKQLFELNNHAQELDKHAATLDQIVTELKSQLLAVHNSTSWRLTSPVRLLKDVSLYFSTDRTTTGKKPVKFNSTWYLEQNPDVENSGIDPLQHYLQHGKAEGRKPLPDSFLLRNKNRWQIFKSVYPSIVEESGGTLSTLKKARSVHKREGLQGVRKRILDTHKGTFTNASDRVDYQEWIRRYDTLDDESRSSMQRKLATHAYQPLISVVMPVYNANPEWLAKAIESVRSQIYPNWELCIADDASTNKTIRTLLQKYSDIDSRIKVVFREKNGHISATSNSAISIVEGDWIALLDHDDVLSEHALFWVADCINSNPSAQMIYSDEDKIDEGGTRSSPYFKCNWNIDLFYSQNMFSHLGVYKTELISAVDGFRIGLEGSQDHDLALRCIEKIDHKHIHHVPKVLYHWRIHEESTARSLDVKPYAAIAGEKALNEHFQRMGVKATTESIGYGYRTKYALPEALPLVSLLIPTRNGLELLKQCIDSILSKTSYSNFEIIIIDNGSDDTDTLNYLKLVTDNPSVRVIRDERPFNYSALNNSAVKHSRGEIIGLINNDIEVISPGWLNEMVSLALQPNAGAIGARLLYPDDTLQHAGVTLGMGGVAGHPHCHLPKTHHGYFCRASLAQSFSAVTAACLIIRKDIYTEVEGLNEADLRVAFNDVDFCLRVREVGYRNIWTPFAELYHHESATRGSEDTPEKKARFAQEIDYMQKQWGDLLLNDPAYSPNLTLEYRDFSYAWPPRN